MCRANNFLILILGDLSYTSNTNWRYNCLDLSC